MSVRLFAALEEGDPEVYKIARDELRLGEFAFFRLLDAHGDIIEPPPDSGAGALDVTRVRGSLVPSGSRAQRHREGAAGIRRADASADKASIAYQIMSAPIANFDATVGTLILGQRVRQLGTDQVTSDGAAFGAVDRRPPGRRRPCPTALHDAARSGAAIARGVGGQTSRAARRRDELPYDRFRLNAGSAYPPVDLVSAFPMDGFEAQQRSLTIRIASTGAIALVVATLIGLALSRQLAQPHCRPRRCDPGNPSGQLRSRDCRRRRRAKWIRWPSSFNEMAAGLKLKDRYHSVLNQVTDPSVADELVAGRIKLGGELRDVTVMFCDIRGFTPLTVGRAPEEVIQILNHHMGAMTRIVQSHQGVINQFAGDAIMALFGAPRSYGDDAQRSVRCACAMISERARLNVAAIDKVRIGIGIASGAMVAGCIGAESRSDYTVVGERVNLGARIAAAAAPGQVLIDAKPIDASAPRMRLPRCRRSN